jgi:hypothetical protein
VGRWISSEWRGYRIEGVGYGDLTWVITAESIQKVKISKFLLLLFDLVKEGGVEAPLIPPSDVFGRCEEGQCHGQSDLSVLEVVVAR